MQRKIVSSTKVTVLTGAGISAESGLKTFRDANGLWEDHRVEDVATPQAFRRMPGTVWKFYKQRYLQLDEVHPNPAHFALVELENIVKANFWLITQNVDGLHSKAGNRNVIEMHGSLYNTFCISCNKQVKMCEIKLSANLTDIPLCPYCSSYLRPDIVWFGEIPYQLNEIGQILEDTEIFIVIGTSGVVYPAAQFLNIARNNRAYCIGINKEKPFNYTLFDEFHEGLAGEVLPELLEKLTK